MSVSNGHAYKLIRAMNTELKKQGYLTIAGKLPLPISKSAFTVSRSRQREVLNNESEKRPENRKMVHTLSLHRLAGQAQGNNEAWLCGFHGYVFQEHFPAFMKNGGDDIGLKGKDCSQLYLRQ